MVVQGEIIKISFNPQSGHEQAGYRPAVVVSNNDFNRYTKMALVCPITNTNNSFPLHIPLDNRTITTGVVLCEHIRALDVYNRGYTSVELIPEDILEQIINVLYSEIEIF